MNKKDVSLGSVTIDVKLSVDYDTMQSCLKLLELYLNSHDEETLIINCNESGNWDLGVVRRY